MTVAQNFPALTILLTLMAAVITSVLHRRAATVLTTLLIVLNLLLNACTMAFTIRTGQSYVYLMGHFPAPWGNEIRAGVLECVSAVILLAVILLSFLGGLDRSRSQIEPTKFNLFCVMVDLTMLSLLALIYTNDLFTAFVFIEISTLAAAGLVMARQNGPGLVGGVRYMIMNLLGSSLFLFGVVILYTITGHLLMTPIHESVLSLAEHGEYRIPLDVTLAMMSVGLGMKSAMYPFEKWLPGAYSNSTPTGAALLSSIVSKGYIFLLIKIYVRVIGLSVIDQLGVPDVLFVFGAAGMIMGSVNAIRAKTLRMMIAYSSVAQIGYIFLAIGMGTPAGIVAALWHLLAHSATKSMLFISASEINEASGGTHRRDMAKGAFYRSPLASFAFSIGALNVVGLPLLSMFVTKLSIGQAAVEAGGLHMLVTLVALSISTLLNIAYFLKTTVSLYIKTENEERHMPGKLAIFCLIGFILLNLFLGLFSGTLYPLLESGLMQFP